MVNLLFGVIIGAGAIIPGISAGTVLVICGIYATVITNVNDLFKSKKQFIDGVIYLTPLFIGAVLGVFALSRIIEFFMERYPVLTLLLFVGLVAITIPKIIYDTLRDTGEKPKLWYLVPIIISCAIVVLFSLLNAPDTDVKNLNLATGIMLVVSGAFAGAAMLFPGLSGAFVVILFGYYSTIINAVNTFNIVVLGLFAVGGVVGLFATSHAIGYLLRKHNLVTHLCIIGFLIGSVTGIIIYAVSYI